MFFLGAISLSLATIFWQYSGFPHQVAPYIAALNHRSVLRNSSLAVLRASLLSDITFPFPIILTYHSGGGLGNQLVGKISGGCQGKTILPLLFLTPSHLVLFPSQVTHVNALAIALHLNASVVVDTSWSRDTFGANFSRLYKQPVGKILDIQRMVSYWRERSLEILRVGLLSFLLELGTLGTNQHTSLVTSTGTSFKRALPSC